MLGHIEELKAAHKQNAPEIVVVGDLANKLEKAKTVAKLSAGGLAVLTNSGCMTFDTSLHLCWSTPVAPSMKCSFLVTLIRR